MNVLDDEREESLAAIALTRLTDTAVGRIGPVALVVRSPIVVAGQTKAGGKRQDEERRGERNESREPRRPRAVNPGVRRVREQQGRVEWREIVAPGEVLVLERGPGRVNDEAGKNCEDDERLNPPRIAAHRLAESAASKLNDFRGH